MSKITEDKYYKITNNLDECNMKELKKNWEIAFMYILDSWHYPKSVKNDLWNWGEHGNNWDILHIENTKYKDYTKKQLIEEFSGDVFYCSDRMSLDRLLRCHWLYQQILIIKAP